MERKISQNTLKWIAAVTMILDHIGYAFLLPVLRRNPTDELLCLYLVFRSIGRISFPLYCMLISEGVLHTFDKKKYFKRILIFAVLSEIPFDMLAGNYFDLSHQNVLFLFVIVIATDILKNTKHWHSFLIIFASLLSVMIIRPDYGLLGFVAAYLMTLHKKSVSIMSGTLLILYELYKLFGSVSAAFVPSVVLCICFVFLMINYSGKKKGSRIYGLNRLFYLIYPLHLLLFGLIRMYVS